MSRPEMLLSLARRIPVLVVVGVLRGYQLVISPMLGPTCRYAPSCSSYAVTAVRQRGVVRGGWIAGRRLLRCHPWAAGGWHPVPPDPRARSHEPPAHPPRERSTTKPPAAETTRTP